MRTGRSGKVWAFTGAASATKNAATVIIRNIACSTSCILELLTTVALGRRVFLGGVEVIGPLDAPLVLAMPFGRTLADSVQALGGKLRGEGGPTPTIVIGGCVGKRREGFCVRTAAKGWRGGILPIHSEL